MCWHCKYSKKDEFTLCKISCCWDSHVQEPLLQQNLIIALGVSIPPPPRPLEGQGNALPI